MWQERRYPRGWRKLARACKEAAGWKCQHCGCPHGRRRKSPYSGNWYRVRLAAAHLHEAGNGPDNPAPRLLALCERCHGQYDWAWRRLTMTEAEWERAKHQILLHCRGYVSSTV